MSIFGDRLSELRKDHKELQKDIAELLHVSPGSVSNYETGAHLPTIDALITLADHYQVTTDYLLGRTDSQRPQSIMDAKFLDGITYGKAVEELMELPIQKRRIIMEILNAFLVSNYAQSHSETV